MLPVTWQKLNLRYRFLLKYFVLRETYGIKKRLLFVVGYLVLLQVTMSSRNRYREVNDFIEVKRTVPPERNEGSLLGF